ASLEYQLSLSAHPVLNCTTVHNKRSITCSGGVEEFRQSTAEGRPAIVDDGAAACARLLEERCRSQIGKTVIDNHSCTSHRTADETRESAFVRIGNKASAGRVLTNLIGSLFAGGTKFLYFAGFV